MNDETLDEMDANVTIARRLPDMYRGAILQCKCNVEWIGRVKISASI